MVFTCISCRVAFDAAEEQRSHFATDWHRYNMKRRVANLPPVSAATFNEKVMERREQNAVRPDPRGMFCAACNKQFATDNAFRTHIQSKKHREREAVLAARPAKPADDDDEVEPAAAEAGPSEAGPSSSRAAAVADADDDDDAMDEDDDADEDGDDDIEDRIAAARRRIQPLDCLFCAAHAATVDDNVAHMQKAHSFFIPDRDILVDLPGLLAYLGEKVAIGNLCLYCPNGGREFGSLEAVRRHMLDKAHCKLAYETDEDRAELADFYDFAGDDEWEDEDGDEDMDGDEETAGVPSIASDGLSLTLPSGRVLGHRSLKVYYSQRLRPAPAAPASLSPADMKIARMRQLLADPTQALVPIAGGHGAYGRGLEVIKARNAGEAKWARKQGKAFLDMRKKEAHKTQVGFKHNNQKRESSGQRRHHLRLLADEQTSATRYVSWIIGI